MYLKLPKIFAERLEIQQHIRKIGWFESIVYYMIDSRYRKTVRLQKWIKDNIIETSDLIGFTTDETNRMKCRKALKYVHDKLFYIGDPAVWEADEYWQTPEETWDKKTGDCEDGAILLYNILTNAGVPDEQLRIVASDVEGGGHAYVCWLSNEDGLEYPLDWCFFYSRSYAMSYAYVERVEYYYGQAEWFSFNVSNAYRRK